MATSRKCEGQLSPTKANSCLPYRAADRATEMAQRDNNPCWDNLPSVILQEIFSYLSHNSRLRASQVCSNWRDALFHPSFWKKLTFDLKNKDSISWSRCLRESFGLSAEEVTIQCDTQNCSIREALAILKKLSCNRQLRKLYLDYSISIVGYEYNTDRKRYNNYVTNPLIQSLVKIIEKSNRLEVLSLGCIKNLRANIELILRPLWHHAMHLTTLSLASVRDQAENYDQEYFECGYEFYFNSFARLSILTLDYEYVNDYVLQALDNGIMERFVIHVHEWNDNYSGTTDRGWQLFVQKNPECELRLNLIHSYVGIKRLDTDILHPSMPLTHLKVLFCQKFNIRVLHMLSSWYELTLKSLIWIDSMNPLRKMPATYDPYNPDSPDPLVLVAWKCSKLEEIVFMGHKYYEENLLAIVRLRGYSLKLLAFPKNDIASDDECWHKGDTITLEIEEIMGRRWMSLSEADLPAVVQHPCRGDSRDVIMPLVLRDQK